MKHFSVLKEVMIEIFLFQNSIMMLHDIYR
jgi:hypothetical protein